VLVYDGDCGFCTASARWLERRTGHAGRIASAQGLGRAGLADLGLTVEDAARAAWWIDAGGRAWRGHLAVAQALRTCPGPFGCLGALATRPPLSWLGAGVYRLVVRWRHLLPGATDACRG
jgi:predicted DCC family thiol-disulfide oxidoreductase YuxK